MKKRRKKNNSKKLRRRAERLQRSRWTFVIGYKDDDGNLQKVERSLSQNALKDFMEDVRRLGSVTFSTGNNTFAAINQAIDRGLDLEPEGTERQKELFREHIMEDISKCLSVKGKELLDDSDSQPFHPSHINPACVRVRELFSCLPKDVVPASVEYINGEGVVDCQHYILEQSFHHRATMHLCAKWGDREVQDQSVAWDRVTQKTFDLMLAGILGCKFPEGLEELREDWSGDKAADMLEAFAPMRKEIKRICKAMKIDLRNTPVDYLKGFINPVNLVPLEEMCNQAMSQVGHNHPDLKLSDATPEFEQWFELGLFKLADEEGEGILDFAITENLHYLLAV